MYDYEQIEDSVRYCNRKLYLSHTNDYNNKKYSELEKNNWEKIAYDISNESNAGKAAKQQDDISYIQVAAVYRKRAQEYVPVYKRVVSNLLLLMLCVMIAFGMAKLFTDYVAFQSTVEGSSMEPALENNDSIIIDKFSYMIGSPKRYDIVVFPVEKNIMSREKSYFIKRVIGLPGETVYIDDGKVYINGSLLKSEKYGRELIADSGIASEPLKLGAAEYFVLGDNRNMSTDSRSDIVGTVHKKDIIGKAVLRIWPLEEFGGLN